MTIILGIDPGSRITGYGLIRILSRKIEYIDSGCIRTSNYSDFSLKLMQIYEGISQLMDTYSPSEVAIEQIFMHQNPNSVLKLAHARGVALVAAANYNAKVYEYTAREVKQNLVGFGAAQKTQVNHMVVELLSLNRSPQNDAGDALAIAICHSHLRNGLLQKAVRR